MKMRCRYGFHYWTRIPPQYKPFITRPGRWFGPMVAPYCWHCGKRK